MKNILCGILLSALLLVTQNIFAQDVPEKIKSSYRKPQNTFFAELGGQGLTFTFNGDFRLSTSYNNLGVRAGIGYLNVDNESLTTIPLGLNYIAGRQGKYFEAGVGATFVSGSIFDTRNGKDLYTIGTMFFGYRSQHDDGGLNFRIGLTVVFYSSKETSFFIPYYPGVSLGYTFE